MVTRTTTDKYEISTKNQLPQKNNKLISSLNQVEILIGFKIKELCTVTKRQLREKHLAIPYLALRSIHTRRLVPVHLRGLVLKTCCRESAMCIVFVIYSLVPRTVHTRLQTQLEQTSLGKLIGTKFWSPRQDFQMKMGSSA